METLKIEIPKGFEVKDFNKKTGEITFKEKPKEVTERIKTVDDVLNDNGVTMSELDKMFKGVPEHFKHQYIAELLCKSLKEGWEPDWDNSNEYKYYPWFVMSSSGFRYNDCVGWSAGSAVGSRLCFKSRKLAVYAGEQFTELYKQFMITK
ncbi:MAG: hypothetical protein J5I47_01880 [Vicingus serpentipes]|nr:hypothetical protein [Vicingus serpentipes]